jgi:hypothetical protein
MAEPIGSLRAILSLDWASFEAACGRAASATNNFGKTFKSLERDVNASGRAISQVAQPIMAGMAAVGAAIGVATYAMIDQSSALVDLADRSGLTVEWLERTGFAASQSGTDMESLVQSTARLQRSLGDGSAAAVRAVEALGLSFSELRSASPDQQMQQILEALGKMPNQTDRATIAMTLLGKSGTQLLPLANDIVALQRRAEELGLVMGDRTRRNAENMGDALGGLGRAFGGLSNQLASLITDNAAVEALIEGLGTAFGNLSRDVSNNKQGLSQWVTSGALLAVDGLAGLVNAAAIASTAWDGLQLVWRSAYNVLLQLTLANERWKSSQMAYTDATKAARDEAARMVTILEGEIAANSDAANAAVSAGQQRQAAIAVVRGEMDKLRASVQAAAGSTLDHTGRSRENADTLRIESEAARTLAAEMLRLAEAELQATTKAYDMRTAVEGKEQELQQRLTDSTLTGTDARIAQIDRQRQAELDGIAQYAAMYPAVYANMVLAIQMYYGQMTAAAQGHYATVELAAASLGISSQAQLQATADQTELIFQQMLASGQFTYAGLVAAGNAAAAAQQAAAGLTGLTEQQQLQQTATIAAQSYMAILQSGSWTWQQLLVAYNAYQAAQGRIEAVRTQTTLDRFQLIASSSSSILRSMFGNNKSAAIAAAVIDTAAAVVKTLGAYPFPWSLIPAAAAAAAGYAQIQTIRSQDPGFAAGTPGTSFVDFGSGEPRMMHGREAVVNEVQGKTLGAQLSGMVRGALRSPSLSNIPGSNAGPVFDPAALRELQNLRAEQRAFRASLPIALRDAVMLARA